MFPNLFSQHLLLIHVVYSLQFTLCYYDCRKVFLMFAFFFRFSIALGFGNAGKFIAENQFLLLMCFLSRARGGGRKPKRFIDFSRNEFRRIKLLFVKRFVQGCSTVTQLMLSEKSSTCVEQIKIHFECFLLNLIAIRNRAKEQNTLKPQSIGN